MSKLDEIFDITPTNDTSLVLEHDQPSVSNDENAEDSDFAYTRKNQIQLIETSKSAVMTAMKIAAESEQPRAIETLAIMLKTASEMNRQLVQMSKDKAEVKATKKGAGVSTPTIGSAQTVNNIVMTGTMQEMLEQLKSIKNNES